MIALTEAAGKLQKLGVIRYARGQITVIDRPKLETLSCECYAVVKAETTRLLPYLNSAVPYAGNPTRGGSLSLQ